MLVQVFGIEFYEVLGTPVEPGATRLGLLAAAFYDDALIQDLASAKGAGQVAHVASPWR